VKMKNNLSVSYCIDLNSHIIQSEVYEESVFKLINSVTSYIFENDIMSQQKYVTCHNFHRYVYFIILL
jgi:hypothetical protein